MVSVAPQGVAYFDGLQVQSSAQMARTAGVSPSRGRLIWPDGATLPTNLIGDLVFSMRSAGGSPTLTDYATFVNCVLMNPRQTQSNPRTIIYDVLDRRKFWENAIVNGVYNVKGDDGVNLAAFEASPRDLAAVLLDALGETGYDVSLVPNDVKLAYEIFWRHTPAAGALQKLVSHVGMDVHLLPDNSIAILPENSGSIPDDTGLEVPTEFGIETNIAPDYIQAYAADTLFESWLRLEPLAEEPDGSVVALDSASYKPSGGWRAPNGDVNFTHIQREQKAAGKTDEQVQDIVRLCKKTVFKLWGVAGFPSGMTNPPGYSGSGTLGNTFDSRMILPLEPTRLLYGPDKTGKEVRKPAEICGKWFDRDRRRSAQTTRLNIWKPTFSIITQKGHVLLSEPAFLRSIGTITPAELYLRCAYRLKENIVGVPWHYAWRQPTGATLGIPDAHIARDDIQEQHIQVYSSDYNNLSSLGSVLSNTTTVASILQTTATERINHYVNTQQPATKTYSPFRDIPTNGVVKQVVFSCGANQVARTVVSIAREDYLRMPQAYELKLNGLQRDMMERDSRSFIDRAVPSPSAEGQQVTA